MLVHSYLYYDKNVNIVSDNKWSKWAQELVQLQQKYPDDSKAVEFYDQFKNWDGNSGAFLNFPDNIKAVGDRLYARSIKVKQNKRTRSKSKVVTGTKRLF